MSTKAEQPKRVFTGVVVSCKPEKTVIVEVTTYKTHPKYKKKYRSSKRYQVHDERNACQLGQTISFAACCPISKKKHFTIAQVS